MAKEHAESLLKLELHWRATELGVELLRGTSAKARIFKLRNQIRLLRASQPSALAVAQLRGGPSRAERRAALKAARKAARRG